MKGGKKRSLVLCLAAAVALSGCAGMPAKGPSRTRIEQMGQVARTGERDFALIDVTRQVVSLLGTMGPGGFSRDFVALRDDPAAVVAGRGDLLSVSIFEASADGLFSGPDERETTLAVSVGEDGKIHVPYAGQVDAEGRRPEEIRTDIEAALQGKAIEPQVQVLLERSEGRKVSVLGDVSHPGRFELAPGGARLLDVVAMAGGHAGAVSEIQISVLRAGRRETVRMDAVLEDGGNNIWIRPGDVIQLEREPRHFAAFGAVRSQKEIAFGEGDLMVSGALARAGGLVDSMSDARGIFLFRMEAPDRLERAGVAVPAFRLQEGVPVVYRFDLSQPQGFFLAQSFEMKSGDMLYVANAPASDFRKFIFTVISPVLGEARSAQVIAD